MEFKIINYYRDQLYNLLHMHVTVNSDGKMLIKVQENFSLTYYRTLMESRSVFYFDQSIL